MVWPIVARALIPSAQTGILSPKVVMRTSVQKRVGGYDARLPHLGDTEMWLRLAADADTGYLRGVDQAYYRRHGQNMSTGYSHCRLCTSFVWARRRCLTIVARGCQIQRAFRTSCTASRPGRRCCGGTCGRPGTHPAASRRRAGDVCLRLLAGDKEATHPPYPAVAQIRRATCDALPSRSSFPQPPAKLNRV